ncbi:TetR/AcrR family transcriptional regulator [Ammoniphilus sp. YIM 78166]|uniref:TetR/AcrR family transcriptional regulator n=1 Tax=Ammoniphilus sp. YIM 78166 TaxID=1644106 RepID=UPI00106F2762|nr:TetR/AcrR family transcriptional regulator [Ammoniphilus sp. YIM 78166]
MTADKIKQVAMVLFGRNGYEETSLVDIATGVGIKKPSIYNHFPSKEAIFTAILNEVLDRQLDRLETLMSDIADFSVEEKLRHIFQQFCEVFGTTQEGLFWKRAIFFPPEPFKEEIKVKFMNFENKTDKLLGVLFEEGISQQKIRKLNLNILLASFYCFVDGLFVEHHYYEPEELKFRMEASWQVYWSGIQNHEGG